MGLLTFNFGFRTSDLGLKTLDFGLWTPDVRFRMIDFGHRTRDFGFWILDFGRQTSDDRLRTSDIRCGCPKSEVGRLEAFSRPDMCELRVGGFKWVRFLGRIPIEG